MSSTNPFAALQSIEGICAKAILFHNIAEGTISDADSGSSCPSVSPSLSPPRKAGEAYCKAQAAGKIRDGDRVAIVVGTDASGSALEAEIKRRVTQPETVATIYMHESALREVITVFTQSIGIGLLDKGLFSNIDPPSLRDLDDNRPSEARCP